MLNDMPSEPNKARSTVLTVIASICFVLAVLFAVVFIVVCSVAWYNTRHPTQISSMPYWGYVVVYGVAYLAPGIILMVVGLILRHRARRHREHR